MRSWQFGGADLARGVGAFDSDFGEGATGGVHFDALDGAVAKGGAERVEVAVCDVGARRAAQVDAAVLRQGEHCAQGQNKEKGYFFHLKWIIFDLI